MNFRSKRWTVLLLISLILLAIGIFIQFSLGLGVFHNEVKSFFQNTFSQNPFNKQSKVQVSLVDSNLRMNFEIIEEDKATFKNFVANWFSTDEEIKNISLGVDKNVADILAPSLPV